MELDTQSNLWSISLSLCSWFGRNQWEVWGSFQPPRPGAGPPTPRLEGLPELLSFLCRGGGLDHVHGQKSPRQEVRECHSKCWSSAPACIVILCGPWWHHEEAPWDPDINWRNQGTAWGWAGWQVPKTTALQPTYSVSWWADTIPGFTPMYLNSNPWLMWSSAWALSLGWPSVLIHWGSPGYGHSIISNNLVIHSQSSPVWMIFRLCLREETEATMGRWFSEGLRATELQ